MIGTNLVTAAGQVLGFRLELGETVSPPVEDDQICYSQHVIGATLTPIPDPSQGSHGAGRHARYYDIGPLVFAPAHVPWYLRSGGGRYRYIMCTVDLDKFTSVTGHGDDWHMRELAGCNNVRSPSIRQLLHRMGEEVANPGLAADTVMSALGNIVLVDLARHFASLQRCDYARVKRLEPWQLHRLQDFVAGASGVSPRLAELASACGLSERSLIRLFKASTGQTISAYVHERQLAKAKRLLANLQQPLKAVAFELGFATPSAFSNAFRKAAGMTPGQYRRGFQ
jgi:AraC family transcriptional regulator